MSLCLFLRPAVPEKSLYAPCGFGGPCGGCLGLAAQETCPPGVQLGGQLCPVVQDSEMAPGPGLSATARLQCS